MIPFTRKDWIVYLSHYFVDFINEGGKILDFGAGDGFISEYLAKKKNLAVELLDICDRNKTPLPLTVYDGKKIPFKENSFDIALSIAVFHHIPKKEQCILLMQLQKVARRIIFIEDTPTNCFEWFFNAVGDTIANAPKGMPLPYSYKSEKKWFEVFKGLGLRVIYKKRVAPWYPIHRTLFVLENAQTL